MNQETIYLLFIRRKNNMSNKNEEVSKKTISKEVIDNFMKNYDNINEVYDPYKIDIHYHYYFQFLQQVLL